MRGPTEETLPAVTGPALNDPAVSNVTTVSELTVDAPAALSEPTIAVPAVEMLPAVIAPLSSCDVPRIVPVLRLVEVSGPP